MTRQLLDSDTNSTASDTSETFTTNILKEARDRLAAKRDKIKASQTGRVSLSAALRETIDKFLIKSGGYLPKLRPGKNGHGKRELVRIEAKLSPQHLEWAKREQKRLNVPMGSIITSVTLLTLPAVRNKN